MGEFMQFNFDPTRNLCQTRPPHNSIENAGHEILILLIKTNLTVIEQQH
jgi:hypothetical protein